MMEDRLDHLRRVSAAWLAVDEALKAAIAASGPEADQQVFDRAIAVLRAAVLNAEHEFHGASFVFSCIKCLIALTDGS